MPKVAEHQLSPSKQLLSRCPAQHGVLAWHDPGTGKTITSLAFMGNFESREIILVLANNSLNTYRNSAETLGLSAILKRSTIKILTYKTSKNRDSIDNYLRKRTVESLKNTIMVLDDAHHLFDVLENLSPHMASSMTKKLQRCYKILLLTAIPFYTRESDFRILINIAAGKDLLPISDAVYRARFFRVSGFHRYTFGWFLPILNAMYSVGATNITELTTAYQILTMGEGANMATDDLRQAAIADNTGVLGPVVPILTQIARGLALLLKINHVDRLYLLDRKKLSSSISQYVSRVISVREKAMPKIYQHVKTVPYNDKQVDFWVRFLSDKLRGEERKRIGLKAGGDTDPIQVNMINDDIYRRKGRAIGNLHFANDRSMIECPKFVAVLEMMRNKTGGMSRSVIYSSFAAEGSNLFAQFLDRNGIKYAMLKSRSRTEERINSIKRYETKKVNILILSPEDWESLNVSETEQLHILEPMMYFARFKQIVSRVAYVGSHKRSGSKVDIYQWCCVTQSLVSKVSKLVSEQSEVDTSPNRGIFIRDLTPDALQECKYNVALEGANEVSSAVMNTSIESSKVAETCNVCYDSNPNSSMPVCYKQQDST